MYVCMYIYIYRFYIPANSSPAITLHDPWASQAWFTHIPTALRSSKGYGKLLTAAAQDVNRGGPLVAEWLGEKQWMGPFNDGLMMV